MKRFIIALAVAVAALPMAAQLRLPEIFTDNMVLQRDKPVEVWGRALPGAKVTVEFGKQKVSATADSAGEWHLQLAPMSADSRPHSLKVASGRQKLRLDDVLVGEVWLASGQSNMEYNMGSKWVSNGKRTITPKHSPDLQRQAVERIMRADSTRPGSAEPLMRILRVEKNLDCDTLPTAGWTKVNGESIDKFSACAYFFGKNLADSLGVPVGIIASTWGGTPIERWKDDGGRCFSKMIKPMAPYTIRGFLWYQGESNLIQGHFARYYDMSRELIDNWRGLFRDGADMPFYFVQLAPYRYSTRRGDSAVSSWESLPVFQRWQDRVARDVPNTACVVISDLVDEGEIDDIHPTFKWEVGRRLADTALKNTYGRTRIIDRGPEVKSWRCEGDSIIVQFDTHGSGLRTRDGQAPNHFEVMHDNNRWGPARAILDGDTVILTATNGRPIKNLRMAWDETYQTNLCNTEGLPANNFNSTFEYR